MLSHKSSAIIFSFIVFSLNYCFSQNDNLQKAKDALTHVSTYLWLARYKHNDSRDLLKSKEYFAEAKILLQSLEKSPNILRLLDKANAGFSDSEVR